MDGPLPGTNQYGAVKDRSLSTPGIAGIAIAVTLVGGTPMVIGVAVCIIWRRNKPKKAENTITLTPVQTQSPQFVPVHNFSCDKGRLDKPRGIAVSNRGEIFVSDVTKHLIQVFSEKGKWLKKIGCNLSAPRGLDIDDKYLYVSNCARHCIAKVLLSSHTLECTSLDNKLNLKYPYAVTVVKEIETVFICDEKNCRVVATDLQFNLKYTLRGHTGLMLHGPVDVAYDHKKNHLYVADPRGDKKITVFQVEKEGVPMPVDGFSTYSTLQGEKTFETVQGICVAGDCIYVSDGEEHVVIVMDLARNLVATIGNGELYNPTAVTVHNGNVYVTSDANDARKAAVYIYELQPSIISE